MTARFLTDIELGQIDSEHGDPAQRIEQGAVGDGVEPGIAQRTVAGEQRRVELVAGFYNRTALMTLAVKLRLGPVPGRLDTLRAEVGNVTEPYRELLKRLLQRVEATRD